MTGYESKRAAAQDKLDDDDALTIAYQSGYYDGKKAAQPAQEPVAKYSDIVSDGGLDPRNTTSPQRPWVGLTAGEAAECWTPTATQTWKNIENALRIKNT